MLLEFREKKRVTDFCAERGLCVHEFALADLGDYSLRNGGIEPYISSSDE